MGIKVNQFDNTGKLIASYNSYSEAADNLGCDESTIRKAVKNNKLVYSKFYFEDAELRKTVSGIIREEGYGDLPKEDMDMYKLDIQINSPYELGQPSNLNEQPDIIDVEGKIGELRKADPINPYNPNNPIVGKNTDVFIINKKPSLPKILFLDIETAPLRAFTWGLWKQNVSLSQIISNWYMISWAAKWLGAEEVFSDVLTPEEAIAEDDSRIVKVLWKVLDQADIIIAHNGDAFDIPKINTRFVLHGLMPPSPYRTIDTLTIARQRFGFTSNRLDFLAKFFGYEGKAPTSFSLWENCMIGDESALYYMDFYCKQDIITLEQVFHKLKPYAKGLPNLDMYQDDYTMVCPVCGKPHLKEIPDKYFYTQAVKYQLYRCKNCGGLARAKKGTKFENTKQISAIPK